MEWRIQWSHLLNVDRSRAISVYLCLSCSGSEVKIYVTYDLCDLHVVYILQRSGQTEQPNPCTVQRVENHGKRLNTCTYFVVRLQCFSLDAPLHNSKTQFQRNPHTSSRGMLYCKILQAEPQSVDRGGGSDSEKPKLLLRNHSLLTRLVQSRLTVKDQMAPRQRHHNAEILFSTALT